VDKALDTQRATFESKSHLRWFALPALLIVFGALLVGEHAIFGTPNNAGKVFVGIVLLVGGVTGALYVVRIKRELRT
jgi:hypothetical protein